MSKTVAKQSDEWDNYWAHRRTLHLGCGEDQPENWFNVDVVPEVEPDSVYDIEETPWPISSESTRHIKARHVVEHLSDQDAFFDEAARVLAPGGYLTVVVPVGENQDEDQDHENVWTYRTPERFARGNQHWDGESEFELVDRTLRLYLGGPLYPLSPAWNLLGAVWPRWAHYRSFAGEMKVTFRKIP